jgi:agmatine deiminase
LSRVVGTARVPASLAEDTPARLGFRLPAEWAPHDATWIAWPHNPTDWPGKIEAIDWVYGEITRKLARSERVRIVVNGRREERSARQILAQCSAPLARVEFFRFPTNRGWLRDCGPIFVTRTRPRREAAIVEFRFNAWARYRDWQKDAQVARRAARALGARLFRAQVPLRRGPVPFGPGRGRRSRLLRRPFVLEGGSIEVNGRGTLLTTEECLLARRVQPRNPGLGRREIEAALGSYLGATNVLWLGRGIAGDDTHGHIDDVCRFVRRRTVVLCRSRQPRDPDYRALEENRERLEGMRLEDGSRIEVARLPMPEPLFFAGQRLPASYANFYIANRVVLMPTFNDPADREALGTLGELFPGREVVGIHAVDLVWGLGTLHCLTQQQPAST